MWEHGAGCLVIAGVTTYLFFPETAGVPVENAHTVFRDHWFWPKVYPEIKEVSAPHCDWIKPPALLTGRVCTIRWLYLCPLAAVIWLGP